MTVHIYIESNPFLAFTIISEFAVQSAPVGTNYARVIPSKEINSKDRDDFWKREEEEERRRIELETKRREQELQAQEDERHKREESEHKRRLIEENDAMEPCPIVVKRCVEFVWFLFLSN